YVPAAQQGDDEAGDRRVLADDALVDLGGEPLQLSTGVDVDRGGRRGGGRRIGQAASLRGGGGLGRAGAGGVGPRRDGVGHRSISFSRRSRSWARRTRSRSVVTGAGPRSARSCSGDSSTCGASAARSPSSADS